MSIPMPDLYQNLTTWGAGTGKSHLISTMYQMALHKLEVEGGNSDAIKIFLTAPTSTAAFNVKGCNLFGALALPREKSATGKVSA